MNAIEDEVFIEQLSLGVIFREQIQGPAVFSAQKRIKKIAQFGGMIPIEPWTLGRTNGKKGIKAQAQSGESGAAPNPSRSIIPIGAAIAP